jgi:predicted DCC family thiol-disulfide oxidoreductase YuxK
MPHSPDEREGRIQLMAPDAQRIWRAADALTELGASLDPGDRLAVACACLAEILTSRAPKRPALARVVPRGRVTDADAASLLE